MKKYTLLVLLSSLLLASCGNEAKQTAKNIAPSYDENIGAPVDNVDASYYATRAGINIANAKSVCVDIYAENTKAWNELNNKLGFSISSYTEFDAESVSHNRQIVSAHENGYTISFSYSATLVEDSGAKFPISSSGEFALLMEDISSTPSGSGSFHLNQYMYESSDGTEIGEYSSTLMTYDSDFELEMLKHSMIDAGVNTVGSTIAQFETDVGSCYDMGDYYRIINYYHKDIEMMSNPLFNFGDPESKRYLSTVVENYDYFDVFEKDGDYYFSNICSSGSIYLCEDLDGELLEEPVLLNKLNANYSILSYEFVPFVETDGMLLCKKQSKVPYTLLLTPSSSGTGFDFSDLDNPYTNVTKIYNSIYPDNQYDVYGVSFYLYEGDKVMFVSSNDVASIDSNSLSVIFEDKLFNDELECTQVEAEGSSPAYTEISVKEECSFSLLLFVDSESGELVKVKTNSYSNVFDEMSTN